MPMSHPAATADHVPPAHSLADLGVPHGFFGRRGGVSEGIYTSLNCGPGSADDPQAVRENQARVAAALGLSADTLLTVHQRHTPDVVTIERAFAEQARPVADGMVTTRPGLGLGVLAADCLPVLFADHRTGVIGAAHAGWRGALGGVLEATLAAMRALGAHAITAAIGPAIRQASYEVGPEFLARLQALDGADAARWFIPSERPDHHRFDLAGYACARLEGAGARVVDLGIDTYAAEDSHFSYRRTTHRGEVDYGRNIAVITLPA